MARDNAAGDRELDQFRGFVDAEFLHNALAVFLNRADADAELVRDLPVSQSVDDQAKDFVLAFREPFRSAFFHPALIQDIPL